MERAKLSFSKQNKFTPVWCGICEPTNPLLMFFVGTLLVALAHSPESYSHIRVSFQTSLFV